MKEITIHSKKYTVNDNEFNINSEIQLPPMVIRNDVSNCDKYIGLLKKLGSTLGLNELFCSKVKFGGYIPINLVNSFQSINISRDSDIETIRENLQVHDPHRKINIIKYSNTKNIKYELSVENEIGIIISDNDMQMEGMRKVSYMREYIYVSNLIWTDFTQKFRYWLKDENDRLDYDNLVNLLIMVKDAGDIFREILIANKPYIDRWTILDTGSTDNTINIINETLSDKEGTLYQEPFINFRDSRNRLLELGGSDCSFNLMLDDTYYLKGDLREFLTIARGDDIADSFSIFITDPETEYSSNRITKPERGLKYKYIIHEILQENMNLCIPINIISIVDVKNEYMNTRTLNRKQNDLELLHKELNENPDDPRSIYYLGETYYCIKDWANSFKYYKRRIEMQNGFNEEIYDSHFKMAVIMERYMNSPWNEVEAKYLECYNFDNQIPDPLFMIGYHYLNENNNELAYSFLKRLMLLEKTHRNMNVRSIITNEYAPKFLLLLCLQYNDYELGLKCASILVNKFRDDFTFRKWFFVYNLLNKLENEQKQVDLEISKLKHDSKLICFVDNGGWESWDGETLSTKGLGGSETWTIQYAETLALNPNNKIMVFCNCGETEKVYNDVTYVPIQNFIRFGLTNVIDVCLISRYTEFLFLCIKEQFSIGKLYLVLHDIAIKGDMLPVTDKLTGILCISEWQKNQFLSLFRDFENKTHVISYGVETNDVQVENKRKYSFIYPSFPNRGLIQLLRMFPKIVERYPEAKLNVFCNLDLDYLKVNAKEEMDEIRTLLEQQASTVTNHGWVNKETLTRYWNESHVWFYPCTFPETCCRVAMEAAASKTFAFCNDLAALNETVGKRGAIIPGNPTTDDWQKTALTNLFFALDNQLENVFIEKNYEWAKTKSYSNVVSDFENRFINEGETESKQQFENQLENQPEMKEEVIEPSFDSDKPEVKLQYIHSKLRMEFGSLEDEYNEQIMASKFLTGTENVLEIGGNVGRNSLIIGYILNRNNNTNFVTLESNPKIAKKLEQNRDINNLNFHIEPRALSKRKLIQKEEENSWNTYVSNVVPKGYLSVDTITWSNLCQKYPFAFDTLVLDCEGAFYYILRDMPEILTNIKMVIMENDYWDLSHKEYIDSVLERNGFGIAYSKHYDTQMPCKNMFYQVWIKGHSNHTIPKDVFQVCIHNYNRIPKKVFTNIKREFNEFNYTLYNGPMVSKIMDTLDSEYKQKYNSCLKYAHKKDLLQMFLLYNNGGVYVDVDFEPLTSFENILQTALQPTFVGVLGVNRNDGLNICLMACTKYNKIINSILKHFYHIKFEDTINTDYGLLCRIVGHALKQFMGVSQLEEGLYEIEGERILLLNEIWNEGDYSSCKIVYKDQVLANARYSDYPWTLNDK